MSDEIDWVEEASRESFPASDAPARPDPRPSADLSCPPARAERAERVAHHEAGHAVVGLRVGLDLVGIDILPDADGGRGHTHFAHPGRWFQPRRGSLTVREREVVDSVLVTFLAGFAAESRLPGEPDTEGSGFDVDAAVRDWVALLAESEEARQAVLDTYFERARDALEEPGAWSAVEALARRLLADRQLDALTAREIVVGSSA